MPTMKCDQCGNRTQWHGFTMNERGAAATCGVCGHVTRDPSAADGDSFDIRGLTLTGGVAVGPGAIAGNSITVTRNRDGRNDHVVNDQESPRAARTARAARQSQTTPPGRMTGNVVAGNVAFGPGAVAGDSITVNRGRSHTPPPSPATGHHTSGFSGVGAGEGYTDTVNSLAQLARLLQGTNDAASGLADGLVSAKLDDETITRINGLIDEIENAAVEATELHRHVENRHSGLADSIAAAGGSRNVADPDWYDDI